ncbi:transcriptional regulator [Thalassotalea maritima]|uniref:winged helix-turn-helix domain-containing protein n=1 Tax=Thalassotalea maritima TaxID=3242416 RepID=UPI0035282773
MYIIGDYKFDPRLAQIIDSKNKISDLSPICFKLLLFLITHQDRLVSKNELIEEVWKHHVSDSSINKAVSLLRKYFCDSIHDPKYIITRRKIGYRLVANVQFIETKAC